MTARPAQVDLTSGTLGPHVWTPGSPKLTSTITI
jgi:hypothetical protein